jgi:hypothetical protein
MDILCILQQIQLHTYKSFWIQQITRTVEPEHGQVLHMVRFWFFSYIYIYIYIYINPLECI